MGKCVKLVIVVAVEDSGAELPAQPDAKRAAIHIAAVEQFSQRGFGGTSMANVAEAAGMSRPALYQYFRNKSDIFASAFAALMDDHVERALHALAQSGTVADQLDGFLQRFEGDLWDVLAASPHTEEILSAKSDDLTAAILVVTRRLWHGLGSYLLSVHPGQSAPAIQRRADWVDVLHFSPKGFKFDGPPIETYRRRLGVLARSVAAEIDTH